MSVFSAWGEFQYALPAQSCCRAAVNVRGQDWYICPRPPRSPVRSSPYVHFPDECWEVKYIMPNSHEENKYSTRARLCLLSCLCKGTVAPHTALLPLFPKVLTSPLLYEARWGGHMFHSFVNENHKQKNKL